MIRTNPVMCFDGRAILNLPIDQKDTSGCCRHPSLLRKKLRSSLRVLFTVIIIMLPCMLLLDFSTSLRIIAHQETSLLCHSMTLERKHQLSPFYYFFRRQFTIEMLSPSTRVIVNETEPLVTVRDPKSPHNFGRISLRDDTLFTAERPGHFQKEYPSRIIEDWVEFMKGKGIKNVLIIMDNNEFDVYSVDLKRFYEEAGMVVYHIPYNSVGSYDKIMNIIQSLDERGEKVVSHCTGGKGRCGRVACAWLCKKWSLTPLEASQEFIDQAVELGLYRLGDVQKLKTWIRYGSC